ncbi:MAG: ATPase [Ponticaulis sp.]|nr:ATPase [Ponticaulis sp.]|tara:strand:+ start:11579 stop:12310 length:732 start_codon:yes stop_codon:yes gene_type:complete
MEMSPTALPKRFYKTASYSKADDGWHLELDGRTPVTIAKAKLAVPTEALAKALAEEWANQTDVIDLPNMTLTRLANVAIDRTPTTRDALASEVQKYAETDLVCFLAEGPTELRARQEGHFAPLRDWAAREFGVSLAVTEGVIAVPQAEDSLVSAKNYAMSQNDFALTGIGMALGLYSSAILSMAVCEGELQAMDAYDVSRIDEMWQIEQWGEDDEAMAKVAATRREVAKLGQWFEALRDVSVS